MKVTNKLLWKPAGDILFVSGKCFCKCFSVGEVDE